MRINGSTAAFFLRYAMVPVACMSWTALIAAADGNLPSGAAIMDKYVQRSGGEDAYKRIKNRVRKTEVDSPNGVTKVTIFEAEPNQRYVESELPRGPARTGSNGEVVWRDGYMGARVATGEERDGRLLEAFFHMPWKWRDAYAQAECTEITEIKTTRCYKVVLTPKRGKPRTLYIALDTMLPLATERTVMGPMGRITVRLYIEDYQDVDGILYPHKIVQIVAGQMDITIVTESIEHNVEMPADRFVIPPAVSALLEKE